MSVAAQEAVILEKLLTARFGGSLNGLAKEFFAAIQDVIEAPWRVAISDFVYPSTQGKRPEDFDRRMRYSAALTRLAAEDPAIHRLTSEVAQLLRPSSALREPDLTRRVEALLSAN